MAKDQAENNGADSKKGRKGAKNEKGKGKKGKGDKMSEKEKIKEQKRKEREKERRRRQDLDEISSSESEDEQEYQRLKVEGKELESIIVPNPEMPVGIQELHEETLKEFIREGVNMYKARWPVLIDFSNQQFRLNKIDALSFIRPYSVIEINLNGNQISHVGVKMFEPFERIKRLRLQHNHMRSFSLGLSCLKLELLDLSHNQLTTFPVVQSLDRLKYLDVSNNAIKEGFDNIMSLTKLKYLYINTNRFNWDQEQFNDTLLKMKIISKTLTHLRMDDNPFCGVVNAYKEWIFTNLRSLKHFDGQEYEKEEKRMIKYLAQPPSSEASSEEEGEGQFMTYTGRKARMRMWQMTKRLRECQDRPNDVLIVLREVHLALTEHVEIADARGRILFDGKSIAEEQMRSTKFWDIFIERDEDDDASKDVVVDSRDPPVIIEEFMMAVDMMMVRQPSVTNKAMALICICLSIPNEDIYKFAQAKLLEYLEAGEVLANNVVENMRRYVFGRLRLSSTRDETKRLLLETVAVLARTDPVIEALRNMSTMILGWLSEPDPSRELLHSVAVATRDLKISIELNKQRISRRLIELMARQSRDPEKRSAIMQMVGNLATHIPAFCHDMVKALVHQDLLLDLDQMLNESYKWKSNDPEIQEMAYIITAINGICTHSEVAVLDAKDFDYITKIMAFLKQPEKSHPALLMNILRAMGAIMTVSDDLTAYEEDLGIVVGLLGFIDGPGYDKMCIQMGAVDSEGQPIQKRHLLEPTLLQTLIEIVRFFKVIHEKASGDPDNETTKVAKNICDRLDKAEREDKLFSLMECPSDDVKIEVIECLKVVPLDNFQPPEVEYLVNMVTRVENLSIGRIECVIAGIFDIFTSLAVDDSFMGDWFRRVHTDCVHIVLNILTRNTARELEGITRFEAEEQQLLNESCINFLRRASEGMRWQEALDIMTSRTSVIAMGEVLRYEEKNAAAGRPVLIEKSGCGRSVQSLLFALPHLSMKGHVAKRVLLRLAEVLEGVEISDDAENPEVPDEDAILAHMRDTNIDERAEKWRLHQHTLFVQIDGLDTMLNYLLDNCPIPEGKYQAKEVLKSYHMVKREETRHKEDIILGIHIGEQIKADVQRHANHYLLENNMDLHNPSYGMPLRPFTSVHDDGNRLEDEDDGGNASAVAASLRVFQSLLKYGSTNTKNKAVAKGRNVEFVRTLVALADQITAGKWYPNGVGSNLLSIFTDLIQINMDADIEFETVVPIYDVAGQVFYRILEQLDPYVLHIIEHRGVGRRDNLRLTSMMEDLYQKLAKCMLTMTQSLQYIRASTDNDLDVVEAAQDNLLTLVIEGDMVKAVVHYLFYDSIVEQQTWDSGETAQAEDRVKTRKYLIEFVSEYLNVNDEMRFEVLQVFNRLEVQHHISLRQSFLRSLLGKVNEKTYIHKLERYILDTDVVDRFHRILWASWIDTDLFVPRLKNEIIDPFLDKHLRKVGIIRADRLREPDVHQRLYVITTGALYIFQPQAGTPCSACDAFEFCPSGPRLVEKVNFSEILRMQCNEEGTRGRIVYKPVKGLLDMLDDEAPTRIAAIMSMRTNLIRQMMEILLKMIPEVDKVKQVAIMPDEFVKSNIRAQLLVEREKAKVQKKKKGPEEQFVGAVHCYREIEIEEGRFKGKMERLERIAVVSTQRFYVLRERKHMWIAEQLDSIKREERAKELERIEKERQLAKERGEVVTDAAISLKEKKRIVLQKREEERIKRERPSYLEREEDMSWNEVDVVNYGYMAEPRVEINFTQEPTFIEQQLNLVFEDDDGRENFRRYALKALKSKDFKRKFVVTGFKEDSAEPMGSIPV